jgi:hypothetical protein
MARGSGEHARIGFHSDRVNLIDAPCGHPGLLALHDSQEVTSWEPELASRSTRKAARPSS